MDKEAWGIVIYGTMILIAIARGVDAIVKAITIARDAILADLEGRR